MSMKQRRSRMIRSRLGKRIELSVRDIGLFCRLGQYRYLRSSYLFAFAGGASETRFRERLGDLFHEGYVERPSQQWEYANARCQPAVYEIGQRAERILREQRASAAESRTYLSKSVQRHFTHALLICDILASIELAALRTPGLRFISWSEILARAPEHTQRSQAAFKIPTSDAALIPDALFGLEYLKDDKRTYRFFALEVDRGTMPIARRHPSQTSYLAKLAAYSDALAQRRHKMHLGISSLLVLTITTSERHKQSIMERLRAQSSAPFLFRALLSPSMLHYPQPALLEQPWERAGHPSLSIGQP
jgi:hypothetical protein